MYSFRLAGAAHLAGPRPVFSTNSAPPLGAAPASTAGSRAAAPLKLLFFKPQSQVDELVRARLHADGLRFELASIATRTALGTVLAQQPPDLLLVCLPLDRADAAAVNTLVMQSAPQLPVLVLASAQLERAAIDAFANGAADYVLLDQFGRLAPAVVQAVERARLLSGLARRERTIRELSREILDTQERERTTLARELHDELGQRLSVLNMLLHRLAPGETQDGALAQAQQELAALVNQVRNITRMLRPPALDAHGLERALEQMLMSRLHDGPAYRFEFAGLPARLTADLELAAYRLVQESVTNILRHAHATKVVIELNGGADGRELEIIVRDDGAGFDTRRLAADAVYAGSTGLMGMRARVHLMGGQFSLTSLPGRGTRMHALLPIVETELPDEHRTR